MTLSVVVFFALTSCNKTDDRDQFVGDYSLKVTGTFVITVNGQNYSEPINVSSAKMSIYKAAYESIMSVSGYYDCSAYVIGNTISMDPMTGTQTQDGVTTQLIVTPRRGALNGSVLSFLCDLTGTTYYQGSSYPVSGTL